MGVLGPTDSYPDSCPDSPFVGPGQSRLTTSAEEVQQGGADTTGSGRQGGFVAGLGGTEPDDGLGNVGVPDLRHRRLDGHPFTAVTDPGGIELLADRTDPPLGLTDSGGGDVDGLDDRF